MQKELAAIQIFMLLLCISAVIVLVKHRLDVAQIEDQKYVVYMLAPLITRVVGEHTYIAYSGHRFKLLADLAASSLTDQGYQVIVSPNIEELP